jgi:hypothetical protein
MKYPPMNPEELGEKELEKIISTFEPDYLFAGKYFHDTLPQLRYFSEPWVSKYLLGTAIPSMNSIATLLNNSLNNVNDFGSMFLLTESFPNLLTYQIVNYTKYEDDTETLNNIWKISYPRLSLIPIHQQDDFFAWDVGNYGKSQIIDDGDIFSVIGKQRNYSFLYNEVPLSIELGNKGPLFVSLEIDIHKTNVKDIIIEFVDNEGYIFKKFINPTQIGNYLIDYIFDTDTTIKDINIVFTGQPGDSLLLKSLIIGKVNVISTRD